MIKTLSLTFLLFLMTFLYAKSAENTRHNHRSRFFYIVVHHTGDDRPLRRAWKNWYNLYPEYNYGITKEGEIVEGRDPSKRGAHCIGEKGKYARIDMNYHSLGVVFEGNYEDKHLNIEELESAKYLINKLCRRYGIPMDKKHVIPHIEASKTICPGNAYKDFWVYIEKGTVSE